MFHWKLVTVVLLTALVWGGLPEMHASPVTALTQVIEGAKKEGRVLVKLKSGLSAASIKRLEQEIRDKFQVELKITFSPTDSMPKDLATAIMEHKAGAIPSYDLMTFGPEHAMAGLEADIFEKVEWKSLLPGDVSRDVIVTLPPYGDVGLSCYTSQQGLIYNIQKVSAKEAPKTMQGLADTRWKGKVGVFDYTASWAVRAHLLGKENVYASLRAILKNGAIQGRYTDLANRYLLGEIWMAVVGNSYFIEAKEKGVPTGWQNLDFVDEESRPMVIRKGALRPNAAKLVAVYLAGPEGARFILEESGGGNAAYPGNYTFDIRKQGKEQGMRIISRDSLVRFLSSDDFDRWSKEIKLILQTGGQR